MLELQQNQVTNRETLRKVYSRVIFWGTWLLHLSHQTSRLGIIRIDWVVH